MNRSGLCRPARVVLRAAAVLIACALASGVPAQKSKANPRATKAASAWLKDYGRGQIDLTSTAELGDDAIIKKLKAMPRGFLGRLTSRRELELLTIELGKVDSKKSAELLLQIAAVGLDDRRYTPQMAPHLVRDAGEHSLATLESKAALGVLVAKAKSKRAKETPLRAAALRALGSLGADHLDLLEGALEDQSDVVRLAAAEGLRRAEQPASVPALLNLLRNEKSGPVLEAAAVTLRDVVRAHRSAVPPEQIQEGVDAMVTALGRADWRADEAMVAYLETYRSVDAVPALIDVLQRFVDHPEQIDSGRLSGLLQHRAYDLLKEMTGAFFPMDRPDLWREFLGTERGNIKVRTAEEVAAAKDDAPSTVSGFFGLPVRGSRVVFLVDLSGSMAFLMEGQGGVGDKPVVRLERAKKELIRAADALVATSRFNLVTFRGHPDPKDWPEDTDRWRDDLVLANDKNKAEFTEHVQAMRADGGTNTWAGLQAALGFGEALYGEKGAQIDELFVLSDGIPSVGEVVDPEEILRLVAETNRFARVRINTVYITAALNARDAITERQNGMTGEEFMRRLAEENNGEAIKL